jgi:membrane-bound serine protease (ClpP class)
VEYYLLWAILLLILGFTLLVMEVFFPSAGILAFLAASSLIGSIVFAIFHSPITAVIDIAIMLGGIPTLLILAFKYWPKTTFGKKILLNTPQTGDVLPDDPDKEFLKGLIGRVGKTKCKLLPSGIIFIDGRKIDAVSEGMPIEVNQEVRVIQVKGKRVVVRPLSEDVPLSNSADPLRRPFDDMIDDPFENPPG